MTKTEFQNALTKGKGRAFMRIRDYGDEEFRDLILHACLNDLRYDKQCEDNRALWLMKIIDASGHLDFYADAILAKAFQPFMGDDDQISELTYLLARRDYKNAQAILYQKFDRQESISDERGTKYSGFRLGDNLIRLDGVEGLRHVAQIVGRRILDTGDEWENGYIIRTAAETLSREQIMDVFNQIWHNHLIIQEFINRILDEENESRGIVSVQAQENLTGSSIIKMIEDQDGKLPFLQCKMFLQNADQKDISIVFEALLKETKRNRIQCYLRCFFQTPMPKVDKKIIELLDAEDKIIRYAAIMAFAQVQDKEVHDLAIQKLKLGRLDTLQLLVKNFEPSDTEIIHVLPTPMDIHEAHEFYTDLLKICEENDTVRMKEFLLMIYENTPCSQCRRWAVKALFDADSLPDALADECRFDAYEGVSDVVAG